MNTHGCNGAPVPPRRTDIFFIEPVDANVRIKVRVYSAAVWGVWTHYDSVSGTSPCYLNPAHCVNGHDPKTLRWKGYILGHNFGRGKITFVQMTKKLYYEWNDQLAKGTSLRGQLVYFSRGKKSNSPQHIEVDFNQASDGGGLPQDCHPRASIYNMLRIDDPGWPWAVNPHIGLAGLEPTG